MSTELTKTQRNDVMTLLKNNSQAIQSVLPKHLHPEKMLRMAYQCIEVTPKLALCSQASFFNAILELASLGLEPGGPLALAHLIPYGKKVQVIIDYKGFIHLANNANTRIVYHPVYEKDDFEFQYGIGGFLTHKPTNNDRGKLISAYAIAYFPSGPPDFEVVDEKIAMTAKSRSSAKNSEDSPWNKTINGERVDEATMWCKTAVRRLAKRIPSSPELQKAAIYDEYQEAGVKQGIPDRLVKGDGNIIDLKDFEFTDESEGLTEAIKGNDKKSAQNAQDDSESTEKLDSRLSYVLNAKKENEASTKGLLKVHEVLAPTEEKLKVNLNAMPDETWAALLKDIGIMLAQGGK